MTYDDGRKVAAALTEMVNEQPTLRDRYAIAALAGLCAQPSIHGANCRLGDVAAKALRLADAMMEARK